MAGGPQASEFRPYVRHGVKRLVYIGGSYDYLLCLAHAVLSSDERQAEPFGGLVRKHKEAVVRANSYCGGQRPPYIIRYYNLLFSHNLSKKQHWSNAMILVSIAQTQPITCKDSNFMSQK
ncbi:3-dehydroquinate synthase [Prevotella sp. MGM1]|nr:3-dehydroquinate synthase [Prevotella sp. MGM1]